MSRNGHSEELCNGVNGKGDLVLSLVRPSLLKVIPYHCDRDTTVGKKSQPIYMDANESGYGSCVSDSDNLHIYPSRFQLELKAKIASFRRAKAEQIWLGVGSNQVIDMVIRVFCTPGQHSILITPPTYGMYRVAATINDTMVQEVNLRSDFQLDLGKVLSAVTERTRIIFLCSPGNPTGVTLKTEDIRALLESPRYSGIVVLDEAYVDFSDQPSLCHLVDQYPRLIVIQTMSKSFGLAGIRLGWAIAHRSIVAVFTAVEIPYSVSRLTSEVALQALACVDVMWSMAAETAKEKQIVTAELKQMPGVLKVFPSETNFIMFQVPAPQARRLFDRISRQGVLLRYLGDKTHCTGCIRISLSSPQNNRLVLDLIAKELCHIIPVGKLVTNGTGPDREF